LFEKIVPLTTGTATGRLYKADNREGFQITPEDQCGAQDCRASVTGIVGNCDAFDGGDPNTALNGAAIVGTLVNFDTTSIGDNVVTFSFQCD
jgi:hypothetical protein